MIPVRVGLVAVACVVVLAGTQADAAGLPDLRAVIDDETFLPTGVERNATVAAGDVAEGCAGATTGRTLVHFTLSTFNEGTADLVLGDPGCPDCTQPDAGMCTNELFQCSPLAGHGHPHFSEYARYELLPFPDADAVATGHKQGFCLEDSICGNKVYDCFNQGLSVGCQDAYPGYVLGCQYVDATGLTGGRYLLRASVNYARLLEESNYDNNVAERVVEICEGVAGPFAKFSLSGAWRTKGTGVSHVPFVDLNPLRDGAQLRLVTADGTAADVVVPGSKRGAAGQCDVKDGWRKTNNSPPTFSYSNKSGFLDAACSVPANGLRRLRVVADHAGRGTEATVDVTYYASGRGSVRGRPTGRVVTTFGVGAETGPCWQGAATCDGKRCRAEPADGAFVE